MRTLTHMLLLALALGAALIPNSLASAWRTQHGSILQLHGTPHLWIADEQGIYHWVGDTRALSGKHALWDRKRLVSIHELVTFPVGDPWLSSGLLKDGDPIYLVKWESDWTQPKLLHIQSIADVELFGINSSNYGKFVLDRPTWEARYGLSASGLERKALASAVPDGVTLPAQYGVQPTPTLTHEQTIHVVPVNTPYRFTWGSDSIGWQSVWEVTIVESRLGDFGGYGDLPENWVDLAVLIKVELIDTTRSHNRTPSLDNTDTLRSRLYEGGCGSSGCWLPFTTDPFELFGRTGDEYSETGTRAIWVYENSERVQHISALGRKLDKEPTVRVGDPKVGWRVWRIRKGEEVYLSLDMYHFLISLGRSKDVFRSYSTVFSVR